MDKEKLKIGSPISIVIEQQGKAIIKSSKLSTLSSTVALIELELDARDYVLDKWSRYNGEDGKSCGLIIKYDYDKIITHWFTAPTVIVFKDFKGWSIHSMDLRDWTIYLCLKKNYK
jgi:hypothetical protein